MADGPKWLSFRCFGWWYFFSFEALSKKRLYWNLSIHWNDERSFLIFHSFFFMKVKKEFFDRTLYGFLHSMHEKRVWHKTLSMLLLSVWIQLLFMLLLTCRMSCHTLHEWSKYSKCYMTIFIIDCSCFGIFRTL